MKAVEIAQQVRRSNTPSPQSTADAEKDILVARYGVNSPTRNFLGELTLDTIKLLIDSDVPISVESELPPSRPDQRFTAPTKSTNGGASPSQAPSKKRKMPSPRTAVEGSPELCNASTGASQLPGHIRTSSGDSVMRLGDRWQLSSVQASATTTSETTASIDDSNGAALHLPGQTQGLSSCDEDSNSLDTPPSRCRQSRGPATSARAEARSITDSGSGLCAQDCPHPPAMQSSQDNNKSRFQSLKVMATQRGRRSRQTEARVVEAQDTTRSDTPFNQEHKLDLDQRQGGDNDTQNGSASASQRRRKAAKLMTGGVQELELLGPSRGDPEQSNPKVIPPAHNNRLLQNDNHCVSQAERNGKHGKEGSYTVITVESSVQGTGRGYDADTKVAGADLTFVGPQRVQVNGTSLTHKHPPVTILPDRDTTRASDPSLKPYLGPFQCARCAGKCKVATIPDGYTPEEADSCSTAAHFAHDDCSGLPLWARNVVFAKIRDITTEDLADATMVAKDNSDVWRMDTTTLDVVITKGIRLCKAIILKETYENSNCWSLEKYADRFLEHFAGQKVPVQKATTWIRSEEEEDTTPEKRCRTPKETDHELRHMNAAEFLDHVCKGSGSPLNALSIPDIISGTQKPRFLDHLRMRTLEIAVTRQATNIGGKTQKQTEARAVDVSSCMAFNIFASRGAFSYPHRDVLGGTWLRTLFGKKLWWLARDLNTNELAEFEALGAGFHLLGRASAVLLQQDDVLIMPHEVPIVHAVLTVETCAMVGGMFWDRDALQPLFRFFHHVFSFPDTTNESRPLQLPYVIEALKSLFECLGEDKQAQLCRDFMTTVEGLSCNCRKTKGECSKTTCPCRKRGSRCWGKCVGHTELPRHNVAKDDCMHG